MNDGKGAVEKSGEWVREVGGPFLSTWGGVKDER